MATTAALVDRVRILMVNRGTRATYTDADIISAALNPVAREVSAVALVSSKSSQTTSVAQQQDYSLPTAITPFLKMSKITYGSTRKELIYLDNNVMSKELVYGEPEYWTIWDNKLRLYPIPSASAETIRLDAYGGPIPCTEQSPAASTDELSFPADAEDALVYGAAAIMCGVDREMERAAFYKSEYNGKLGQIRSRLAPNEDRPVSIQDRFEGDAYFFA